MARGKAQPASRARVPAAAGAGVRSAKKVEKDCGMSNSYSLFTAEPSGGSMSEAEVISDITSTVQTQVRAVLAQDLRECRLARPEVARQLGITVAMLDAYIAETKPHRFPAELIPAWIRVVGSRRILSTICEAAGLSIATPEDMQFAELGRVHLRGEKLGRKLWEKV